MFCLFHVKKDFQQKMYIFEGRLTHNFRIVGVSGTVIVPALHFLTSAMLLLLTVGKWKAQRWGDL
jgi:hypothetical protein